MLKIDWNSWSSPIGVAALLGGVLLIWQLTPRLSTSQSDGDVERIKSVFNENTGGKLKIKRAAASPVSELVELELEGGAVGYVDRSGRYVLIAPMIDTKTQRIASNFVNMGGMKPGVSVEPQATGANQPSETAIRSVGGVGQTGMAMQSGAESRVDIAALTGGITWKHGTGSKRLVVFSDPHCPYCKQLDQVLRDPAAMADIAVEVFPYPLRNQHPRAASVSAAVWCQPESSRAIAWQAAVDGVEPQAVGPAALESCNKKVEAVERIGEAWGVAATPTMFAPNGARMSGAASAAEIVQFINANLR